MKCIDIDLNTITIVGIVTGQQIQGFRTSEYLSKTTSKLIYLPGYSHL